MSELDRLRDVLVVLGVTRAPVDAVVEVGIDAREVILSFPSVCPWTCALG